MKNSQIQNKDILKSQWAGLFNNIIIEDKKKEWVRNCPRLEEINPRCKSNVNFDWILNLSSLTTMRETKAVKDSNI